MPRKLSFLLFVALTLAATPSRAQSPASISEELANLYQADKADRDLDSSKFSPQELEALNTRDRQRRERVLEIVRAQQLATADDYFHAAMIFQHGDGPQAYLLAHVLASIAAFKGHAKGKWLSAATLDRYLASLKQDQFFGTQFFSEGLSFKNLKLSPPLNGQVTEALRQEFTVPPPEETLKRIQASQGAEELPAKLVRHFDYERAAPLDLQILTSEDRGAATVYDLTYASPQGGRVPAYLVVPHGKGPFAAILFGHWAMPGSPTRNRSEFLPEALAYARAGAVSLLIDAPFARPGQSEDDDFLSDKNAEMRLQQVLDMRRGVDLLLARDDVDPERIGLVGHSYDAAVGGILAGVEKRIATFVLMAGGLAEEEMLFSDEPAFVEWRQRVGEDRIKAYLAKYGWLDPAHYVSHATPASVLLQYARKDEFVKNPDAWAQRDFKWVSEPKELKLYDAGHALDAQARRDRYFWLRTHLRLGELDPAVLDALPQVK